MAFDTNLVSHIVRVNIVLPKDLRSLQKKDLIIASTLEKYMWIISSKITANLADLQRWNIKQKTMGSKPKSRANNQTHRWVQNDQFHAPKMRQCKGAKEILWLFGGFQ